MNAITKYACLLIGLSLLSACQARSEQKEETAMSEQPPAAEQVGEGLSLVLQLPEPITGQPRAEQANVRLLLRNHSQQPLTLKFRSGQSFEVEFYEPNGRALWRWSDGKMFTMALRDVTLMPGDEQQFAASIPLLDSQGNALPDGVYRVRFRLLAGINELMTGSSPLQASGVIILGSASTSGTALM
jgi:hypothetical protein